MLDIAEECFIKIAEELIRHQASVGDCWGPLAEFIEEQGIGLLSPVGFLQGLKDLGLGEITELEVACLLRVLAKPELDNAIILQELMAIMENFGIFEKEDPGARQSDIQPIEEEPSTQTQQSQSKHSSPETKVSKSKEIIAEEPTAPGDTQQNSTTTSYTKHKA